MNWYNKLYEYECYFRKKKSRTVEIISNGLRVTDVPLRKVAIFE